MSARDDALWAIVEQLQADSPGYCDEDLSTIAEQAFETARETMCLVDAIPADVLARLAIERGALKPWTLLKPDGRQAETVYIINGQEP